MNDFATAAVTQIHEVDHDARGAVARQEGQQHHQMYLGQFLFPQQVSLLSLVSLVVVFVQNNQLLDLLLHGQEHAHVGEEKNKNSTKQSQVGKNESTHNETNHKQHATARDGQNPDYN